MHYPDDHIDDVAGELNRTLDTVLPESGIRAGDRVAIGVGSRGIDNIVRIVRTLCDRLRTVGAHPFVIPAMGSHGGATDAGQKKVLATLGITPESCGAPVCSALAAEQVGTAFGEVPVFFSRDALAADHSICINRIKPHTKFRADVGSGLFKMLCVGMGKHRGALSYHKWALKYGFAPLVKAMGEAIIRNTNFRFGIGIAENAHDRPHTIEAIPARQIAEREAVLLNVARENFPRLPFSDIDALVIGRIGKEISGSGMDPNVTGRAYDLGESDFSSSLRATRVAILNLSEKTGGNAIGLGNADFITEKVFRHMDYEATVMNAMTSMSLRKAFIPIRLPSEQKAVQACFTTLGPVAPEKVRAVIIRDTLRVSEFWASSALKAALQTLDAAEILDQTNLRFTENGDIRQPNLKE
ncbi:nickel-dependent lactate racemase [Desulfonema ishimotonii]|nr:nickel-dependent lactate racemase [Desulfonema ishimotonii]